MTTITVTATNGNVQKYDGIEWIECDTEGSLFIYKDETSDPSGYITAHVEKIEFDHNPE